MSLRLLSAFSKNHGYTYLRSLVQPLLHYMRAMPPGASYDIDPTRAYNQNIDENLITVQKLAETFLEEVTSSIKRFPP